MPRYVADDPVDDHVVHAAPLTESAWLVSDDHHIVPDEDESTFYETVTGEEGEGFHRVTASRWVCFHESRIEPEDLALGEIDSSWLFSAVRWLRDSEASAED